MRYSGLGATLPAKTLTKAATYTPASLAPSSSSVVPRVLVIGGLAVAGFLVYRHFKKKG